MLTELTAKLHPQASEYVAEMMARIEKDPQAPLNTAREVLKILKDHQPFWFYKDQHTEDKSPFAIAGYEAIQRLIAAIICGKLTPEQVGISREEILWLTHIAEQIETDMARKDYDSYYRHGAACEF